MARPLTAFLTSMILTGCTSTLTGEPFSLEEEPPTTTSTSSPDSAEEEVERHTETDEDDAPVDTDEDGLSDAVDDCPAEPETVNEFEDEDGCPDDPCVLDDDFDGIGNCDEELLGTDPNNTDTDGDFLSDFEELQAGTNPLSTDTDGDGLSDERELFYAFDPLNPDTLGDGIQDGKRFMVHACQSPDSAHIDFHESAPGDWHIALSPLLSMERVDLTFASELPGRAAMMFGDASKEVAALLVAMPPARAITAPREVLTALGDVLEVRPSGLIESPRCGTATSRTLSLKTSASPTRELREHILLALTGATRADVRGLPPSGGVEHSSFEVTWTIVEHGVVTHTLVSLTPARAQDHARQVARLAASSTHVERESSSLRTRCSALVSRLSEEAPDGLPVGAMRLPWIPVEGSMRVHVAAEDGVSGELVPRSDTNGYTFDAASNALRFHGSYRDLAERSGALRASVHHESFSFLGKYDPCR